MLVVYLSDQGIMTRSDNERGESHEGNGIEISI